MMRRSPNPEAEPAPSSGRRNEPRHNRSGVTVSQRWSRTAFSRLTRSRVAGSNSTKGRGTVRRWTGKCASRTRRVCCAVNGRPSLSSAEARTNTSPGPCSRSMPINITVRVWVSDEEVRTSRLSIWSRTFRNGTGHARFKTTMPPCLTRSGASRSAPWDSSAFAAKGPWSSVRRRAGGSNHAGQGRRRTGVIVWMVESRSAIGGCGGKAEPEGGAYTQGALDLHPGVVRIHDLLDQGKT